MYRYNIVMLYVPFKNLVQIFKFEAFFGSNSD